MQCFMKKEDKCLIYGHNVDRLATTSARRWNLCCSCLEFIANTESTSSYFIRFRRLQYGYGYT